MHKKSSGSVRIFYPPCSREEVIAAIRRGLPSLHTRLPVSLVALIGSYAAGRHTAASDIDLLVLYRGKPREDAYRVVKTTLGIKGLEPHVYAEDEAGTMQGTIQRMLRGGIVVYRHS